MKSRTVGVEDTDANRQTCMKYCGICPSYKKNDLGKYQPELLFCSRGTSNSPCKTHDRCFCLACEIFTGHGLILDHFCARQ